MTRTDAVVAFFALLGLAVLASAYLSGRADGYDEGARDGYASCASAEVS